ncbi:DUF6387 family protein [Stenotrophomonas maltophilia]|uniref:DUF6387 family protein n=1 Tax=Stenotrophomonas maltophilia TaxID=40324 RepID=UPI00131333B4|nr:DUF6387 family protein [Stenotrophomonas maltophilia]MCO7456840.1 DUF6387 family protein [Stenotrophomonas maltophilia]MCO7465253.1 DUF6387 family protein [Stenotrophomonas maltophilia]MCO7483078.1 DUF6387 family protein [Stenotrophomonas maltophilia]MCO7491958.1 DUF6387 family protein [Stenotrophomonas maltophilia]
MARKASGKGIPSWFELEKYNYLSDLDAAGWLLLLDRLIPLMKIRVPDEITGEGRDGAVRLLTERFIALQEGKFSTGRSWRVRSYLRPIHGFGFGTVQALDNHAVAWMGATLARLPGGEKFMRSLKQAEDARMAGDYSKANRLGRRLGDQREFGDKPFFVTLRDSDLLSERGSSLTPNRAISVRLSAPDDIIVEDFKRWLADMRKLDHHVAAKRSFGRADFATWIERGYVPLALIEAWAAITGEKPTLGVLCETVFPGKYEVDDIRKTYRPGMRAWLTAATAEGLAAQTARDLEANGQEEGSG